MGAIESHKTYGLKIRESANDGSDFGTPDADYRFLFLGEDGLLHVKDAANAVTDPYTGGSGGGISSGTSFPGSPATDDLFYRTDRDLLYFYDGTRWLTTTLYREGMETGDTLQNSNAAPNVIGRWPVWHTTHDLYLEKLYMAIFPGGTNTGSHYWTATLYKSDAAGSATSLCSADTSADTQANWVAKEVAIGAVMGGGATYKVLELKVTKTGSPTNYYVYGSVSYRLIG